MGSGLVLGGRLGFQVPQRCHILGWLRDVTGNYTISFLAAGAFLLAGSLLILTLPGFFHASQDAGSKEGSPAPAPTGPETPCRSALEPAM